MSYLRYGFVRALENANFDDALVRVREALKEQGFGVVSEIDLQNTIKTRLEKEFRRYTILGACNPLLAKQALDLEPQIGLLLPCNVVVQEAPDKGVIVSIANPREIFSLVDNPAIVPIGIEAAKRLRHVVAALR